ncbi:LLM class flavin-dependent oxidoreductase [Kitasatospora purpeofusca]|uniref:LLM class flavin-dependent oxidoreductase n=1 Tax=Kitasatospora purpeofusca TaxID=67352 RepID=UPI0036C11692
MPSSVVWSRPVQQPRPPLLGGFGAESLARAGRRAEGWLGVGLPLAVLEHMWRTIRRHAADAGRDPGALRMVLWINPVVTAEPASLDQVPHRGTVDQLAAYLAMAVRTLGAEPLIDPHFSAPDADSYRDVLSPCMTGSAAAPTGHHPRRGGRPGRDGTGLRQGEVAGLAASRCYPRLARWHSWARVVGVRGSDEAASGVRAWDRQAA